MAEWDDTGDAATADAGWGDAGSSAKRSGAGRTSLLLWLAMLAVLLSALTFVPGGQPAQIAGYLLASVGAFTLVAFFRRRSVELVLTEGIVMPASYNRLAWMTVVAGFALSILHAWFLAIPWAS